MLYVDVVYCVGQNQTLKFVDIEIDVDNYYFDNYKTIQPNKVNYQDGFTEIQIQYRENIWIFYVYSKIKNGNKEFNIDVLFDFQKWYLYGTRAYPLNCYLVDENYYQEYIQILPVPFRRYIGNIYRNQKSILYTNNNDRKFCELLTI